MGAAGLLSRLIASDRFADVARVSISLIGVAAFCYFTDRMHAIVSIMLGVIACALAETDDSGWRKIGTLLVTLICFAGTSAIVEFLDAYPPLFALGLVSSTFALVMLGAVSGRWGQVATGTLILAVYTMIGLEQRHGARDLWSMPAYLTCGAAGYGLLSLAWSAIAPMNAVRQALAALFEALAGQIECAAMLFAPYRETDYAAARLTLANANAKVVAAMNAARLALLDRLRRRRPRGDTEEKLHLYFTAQDIHERVHSSHYPHEELAKVFFHSDLLFRCAHLLKLQAGYLRDLAGDLRRRKPLPPAEGRAALEDFAAALDHAAKQAPPAHLIDALGGLKRNVEALQALLERPQAAGSATGHILQDPEPSSLIEAAVRLRSKLTVRSGLFRHAVRLSLGLLLGYLCLKALRLEQGHWIMLTTLFVMQPSFGATKRRMIERIIGTAIGVIAGWAALRLFPDALMQLPLIVGAAATFFAYRRRRYTVATAMITLFVVLCFEQIFSGDAVIVPRLFDTLIGAGIAFVMLYFVLPDWKVRRLKDRIAEALLCYGAYLRAIVEQYDGGRADDLAYRIVRRDAHNAQTAFEAVVRDILAEPRHTATKLETALRALGHTHDLMSCLSALGAHRAGGILAAGDGLAEAGKALAARLDALAAAYRVGEPMPEAGAFDLDAAGEGAGETRRLIARQFARIDRLCRELASLVPALSAA